MTYIFLGGDIITLIYLVSCCLQFFMYCFVFLGLDDMTGLELLDISDNLITNHELLLPLRGLHRLNNVCDIPEILHIYICVRISS